MYNIRFGDKLFFSHNSKWNQPTSTFFETVGSHDCFITGTDFTASTHQGSCVCHQNYQGQDCGIPILMWESSNNSNSPPVWKSNFNWSRIHKRSGLQRRLIHALPVNLEIDLFEGQNQKTCGLHSPVLQ